MNLVLMYIDPGVGFLALQVLSAAVLGTAFYFRRSIRVVLRALRFRFGPKNIPREEPTDGTHGE